MKWGNAWGFWRMKRNLENEIYVLVWVLYKSISVILNMVKSPSANQIY